MDANQMIAKAAHALDEAHCLAIKHAETAEVDPEKTDGKVQRLAFVADEWMKLAAITHEMLGLAQTHEPLADDLLAKAALDLRQSATIMSDGPQADRYRAIADQLDVFARELAS